MPGLTGGVVELHIGNDIRELTTKAELPSHLKNSSTKLAKTAIKIYEAGQKEQSFGDHEKAYIHYMKYLNIHAAVRKSKEYKADKVYYDSLIEVKTVLDAMSQAEVLSNSLKTRYEEREAELAAAKLENLTLHVAEGSARDDLDDLLPGSVAPTAESKSNGGVKLEPSISSPELYSLLRSEDHSLLIDVRSEEKFNESHIKLESVDLVNIPEELLTAGILTSKLRGKLSARNLSLFDARANYRRIVLLDWSSSLGDLQASSPLQNLKNAIYKWDQQTRLASEPQILEGGYTSWLRYYPQYSTNASVQSSQLSKIKPNVPDLTTITYDFFDDEKKTREVEAESRVPPVNGSLPVLTDGDQPTPVGAASPVNQSNIYNVAPPVATPSLPAQPNRVVPSVNRSNKPHSAASGAPITSNIAAANGPLNAVQPKSQISPSPVNGVPGTARPSIDRTVKPGQRAPPANHEPVKSNGISADEELQNTLREQTSRMIAETGDSLKQLNAKRAEIAELTRQKQSESQAVADLQRLKRQLENDISKQENKLRAAKQVQHDHDTSAPQVNRELKPNLEDWELRLSQLQTDSAEPAALSTSQPNNSNHAPERATQQTDHDRNIQARRLEADAQSRLIEEQNKLAKQEQARREADRAKYKEAAEQAKLAEEQRKSAEQAKLAEEQRKSAEHARLAEEQRKSAEQARLEEQRKSAEQARLVEEQRKSEEQARLAEEQRKSAEKARLAEEQRKSAEQSRLAEEQRKLAEQARLAEERRLSEMKRAEERRTNITRAPSTNELPPGWQRKLDTNGVPYYFNYKTRERTATPPQLPAAAPPRPQPGLAPAGASHPPSRPQTSHASSPSTRTTTRLKSDETTFGIDGEISSNLQNKSKMKKFSSIPNLTQVDDSSPVDSRPSPGTDRSVKPPNIVRQQSLQPLAQMDRRRLSNLSPEYGSTMQGLTGLYNMGNTCYMNSAIQCLSHTVFLCKYFTENTFEMDINRESRKGTKGAISIEFALLVKCLWTGNYRYVVPRDFKHVFGREKVDFDHCKQMDSQEFLNTLLDTLHEDLNARGHIGVTANPEIPSKGQEDVASKLAYQQYKNQNESIIVSLFTGQQKSSVWCNHCGERSNTFDTFNSLPLEIRTSSRTTLMHCIEQYTRVDDAEGYKCEKCHRKQAKRKLDLYRLPPVLLIFFKRFDQYSYQFSKKTNMIDFPEILCLKGVGDEAAKDYRLYGVVNHYGSLDSGHYTAFSKSTISKSWHKFNDETVTSVRSSDIKSSAAYILFYSIHPI